MASSGDGGAQPNTAVALRGLTQEEVLARRARGEGNTAAPRVTRSYRQIFVENVVTFINMCLFGLGIALVLLGRTGDALVSTAVILTNVVVSVAQELRAKWTLDRIALLVRPTASVLRDDRLQTVAPSDLVVGDVLHVEPGDQILVDGRVLTSQQLAVDQSLLTGEAELVAKAAGDEVYSGTYCVSGSGYYEAERVGARSLANQMTAGARAYRRILTPLQRQINLVVRLVLLLVLYLEFLLVVMSIFRRVNLADSVENSTIVAGLVPNGLFLSIAVAYALGAVRILRFGALVQQANAIESLSHVDVLCLDKTGTLTANRLQVAQLVPLGLGEEALGRVLGACAASASAGNKTLDALRTAWPSAAYALGGEVPFSSARQWSAVAFTAVAGPEHGVQGTYVLGAPEVLRPALHEAGTAPGEPDVRQTLDEQVRTLTAQGLRVLLLTRAPRGFPTSSTADRDESGASFVLPTDLEPLGLVALRDELRPEARETLNAFLQAGIQPKIISGDHPETVAALARQAGLPADLRVLSGPELERMSEAEFEAAAESGGIFGRITPQLKERLVGALRRHGHYVAMIGDGVNDVLSLKQADLGIAMRSGSQAARGVADVVLMQDSFAVLVPAVAEGQRILNGMQHILQLFLARIGTVGLVIVSSLVVGTFPLELRQGSLVTFFSVGVPAIALAVWAHPGLTSQRHLMRDLGDFVMPAVLLTSVMALALFVGTYALHLVQLGAFGTRDPAALLRDYPQAQTTLTAFLVLCGLLLMIFVEPPTAWWAGAAATRGDWRPTILAVGLMLVFAVVTVDPALRTLFVLAPLGVQEYVILGGAVALWVLALRGALRTRVLSRYLSEDQGGAVERAPRQQSR
jgi:cation-transporting P-type ATPase E